MTSQIIKQKLVFQEKITKELFWISPLEIRELEELIRNCGQYYSKEYILSHMKTKYVYSYNVLEEKVFEGIIFPCYEKKLDDIKISYNNNEYNIYNFYFDADEGYQVFEVVVKNDFLKENNFVEIETAVDEFIETHADILEKNKENDRLFNEARQAKKKTKLFWWKNKSPIK